MNSSLVTPPSTMPDSASDEQIAALACTCRKIVAAVDSPSVAGLRCPNARPVTREMGREIGTRDALILAPVRDVAVV